MRLGHTIVPAYDKVKSSIFLVKGHEAQGDLVGSQVFDVSGDGPLVVVGVGDAGEMVAVELVAGYNNARL